VSALSVARQQLQVPSAATSLVVHIPPRQRSVLAHRTGDRSPPQSLL